MYVYFLCYFSDQIHMEIASQKTRHGTFLQRCSGGACASFLERIRILRGNRLLIGFLPPAPSIDSSLHHNLDQAFSRVLSWQRWVFLSCKYLLLWHSQMALYTNMAWRFTNCGHPYDQELNWMFRKKPDCTIVVLRWVQHKILFYIFYEMRMVCARTEQAHGRARAHDSIQIDGT